MAAVVDVDADYLVVGAGAMGMAFTDALVRASSATVAIVDSRHAPGGHWLEAYPFVRLHQASAFYGVASTRLGGGRLQVSGPEAGLHERATGPEVCAYYSAVMQDFVATGRVTFFPSCDRIGHDVFRSRVSGRLHRARRARVVDATYLSGRIPARTPPPFDVERGARAVPVGDIVHVEGAPARYVIVGAGKTAMDAVVWLLQNGVAPDAVTWVRPRDPWVLNRAVVQPDPAVFLAMGADTLEAASEATSADELFLRLEERGVMRRIDPSITPTMAKTPTPADWELDLLRRVEDAVRRGRLRAVQATRLRFDDGDVAVPAGSLIVHCAAGGLAYPPLVPIWQADAIRPRPVRVGFPCLGAALCGYVEATRATDDEKNAVCRPSPYADTPTDWLRMQIIGAEASRALGGEPDVRAWANETWLNPARVPAERAGDPAVVTAGSRLRAAAGPARERMASLLAASGAAQR